MTSQEDPFQHLQAPSMASIPQSDLTCSLPPSLWDIESFLSAELNDNIWSTTNTFLGNGNFDLTPPKNDQASPDFRMRFSNCSAACWSSANVYGSATKDFATSYQCGSCAASREDWVSIIKIILFYNPWFEIFILNNDFIVCFATLQKVHCIGNNGQTGMKIPRYSVEERKDRIHRYLKKRNQRNFNKTIKV